MPEPREEAFDRMGAALEKMVRAGWVKSYDGHASDTGYNIKWTDDGIHALEAVWCMMEELGGNGRGVDQSTWGTLGILAIMRFRDPSLAPPSVS